jgi:putrescine transport system ATP-binding protein
VVETVFEPWADLDAAPLISFKNVTKRFGDFVAIDDLTLDIFEKEFFALLGPSGCGKTTMMRMLAGFEDPTSGSMSLSGQDIAGIPPNKRAVNMMFQSYALFPHLSVWENIAFGLRRDGVAKDALNARVEEMLKLTRLEKFARRKPHQISGGQRQRVALARSLAKAPKLLLLDIQEKTGTTFVIVTHDQEEAMTVASRVAVMDEGRIVQVATPEKIYEAPNSVYVADFIGDVNILTGPVKAVGEDTYSVDFGGLEPATATSERPFSEGATAHLAIRPEKIAIHSERPDAPNAVQGKVLDIAYLGNLSTYYVELPNGQLIKAQTANTRRISRRAFTWEDPVWVSWSATAGVLLEK